MKISIVANKLFKVILLSFVIFQVSLMIVNAQEPVEEEEVVVNAPSGQLNLTLHQLGYDTLRINQDRRERYYRIDLPGNFQISATGNYLDLTTSHLPAIPDRPTFLRVEVNGQLLSSIPLTDVNAITNTTRIELPDSLLQTGLNSLLVAMDSGTTCDNPGSVVNAHIDAASTLSFGYQQQPYPADLALYPFPFVERQILGIPVALILPDTPTSDDLSAAATIAAGLGKMSGGSVKLEPVLVSDLTPEIRASHHLIVIGKPDDNPLFNDLQLPLAMDSDILKPGYGVVQEVVSPWNEFRLVLVVSGLDNEGILRASHALNRQAHFLSMRGPVAVVLDLLPLDKSEVLPITSMTLRSLGYQDEVSYGTAPHDYFFDFALPPGWRLENPPYFVLKFAHADILDPNQSAIDIRLNNVPIGSTILDKSNVQEGELTASLPARLLKTGTNRLQVSVEMGLLEGDKCQDEKNQRAWTAISSESEVFLPYNAVNLPPDLKFLPYPFNQDASFDQTLFVLPEQVSQSTLKNLLQLAILLGTPSRVDHISAQVIYAAELDQAARENHHLILFGRSTQNSLLAEINDSLPQPFLAESDILKPLVVDTVAFLPDPNRDAGLLQLIVSPWNEKYSLLAITGTTDLGVELAVQALLQQANQLKGNLAVVEPASVSSAVISTPGEPVPTESIQIRTYSVDTRSLSAANGAQGSIDQTIPESELVRLAQRWWR